MMEHFLYILEPIFFTMHRFFTAKDIRSFITFLIQRLVVFIIVFPFSIILSPIWLPTFTLLWCWSSKRVRRLYLSWLFSFFNFWVPQKFFQRLSRSIFSTHINIRLPDHDI